MTTTPKPITGICPACGKRTVHRCISPGARVYQCRRCGKTCEPGEIRLADALRRHANQVDLFREETERAKILEMAIASVELADYNDTLEAERKARDDHE